MPARTLSWCHASSSLWWQVGKGGRRAGQACEWMSRQWKKSQHREKKWKKNVLTVELRPHVPRIVVAVRTGGSGVGASGGWHNIGVGREGGNGCVLTELGWASTGHVREWTINTMKKRISIRKRTKKDVLTIELWPHVQRVVVAVRTGGSGAGAWSGSRSVGGVNRSALMECGWASTGYAHEWTKATNKKNQLRENEWKKEKELTYEFSRVYHASSSPWGRVAAERGPEVVLALGRGGVNGSALTELGYGGRAPDTRVSESRQRIKRISLENTNKKKNSHTNSAAYHASLSPWGRVVAERGPEVVLALGRGGEQICVDGSRLGWASTGHARAWVNQGNE